MKKLFVALFLLSTGMAFAQSDDYDFQMIQAYFGKNKQVLVKDFMVLNETQSAAFWPLYEAYEKERQALVKERFEELKMYIDKSDSIDNKTAHDIMSAILSNDQKLVKLQSKYLDKMTKSVGGIKSATFFQLETYLRNLIFSQIQERVPSIDSLKSK